MDRRPNFIVIHADQMRGDCLGFTGMRNGIATPALDAIANQGTYFSSCYAACPVCIPARLSLLTGQSPQKIGVYENVGIPYLPLETTLPAEMGRGGYQTALVGRTMHTYPFTHPYGFEYYLPGDPSSDVKDTKDAFFRFVRANAPADSGDYYGNGTANNSRLGAPFHLEERFHQTTWTTNRALEFIDNRDNSRPFMLFVGYYAPHSPLNPPAEYFNRYYFREDLDNPVVADYDTEPVSNGNLISSYVKLEGDTLRAARAGYYGNITFMDHQIARLLARVTMMPNTYVIFTSDHGELLGDHYGMHKSRPWQGAVHLPLLISGPGIRGKRTAQQPVSWQDIAPTILGLAGLPVPQSMDGVNLSGLLKGDDSFTTRDYVHGETIHRPPDFYGGYEKQQRTGNLTYEMGTQYLTDGKMKYIWHVTSGREQLFDLEHDYQELHDLSTDPAYGDVLENWRMRLVKELAGRPEGYSDGEKLIPGKRPSMLSPEMQALHDKRLDEGYQLPYERPRVIPNAKGYRNTLR